MSAESKDYAIAAARKINAPSFYYCGALVDESWPPGALLALCRELAERYRRVMERSQ